MKTQVELIAHDFFGRTDSATAIRRGLGEVVKEIQTGTFGHLHKGSPLEPVVKSIAEQRLAKYDVKAAAGSVKV